MVDIFCCLEVTNSHKDYNKDSHVHERHRYWHEILPPQICKESLTLRDKKEGLRV